MKRFLLLTCLCCCVMMASTSYTDTTANQRIQMEAKQLTDRKLESLSTDKYRDVLIVQFRDLRGLIDSLYAEVIKKQESIESASQARDSVTHVLMYTLMENAALKASNESHEKNWGIVTRGLDYLFISILVYIGALAAQGTYHGYREWRSKNPRK